MAYGAISGIAPNKIVDKKGDHGLHRNVRTGIAGGKDHRRGAESIVLTGGYEDDVDLGDVILYTGGGGRQNGIQVADQSFKGLNQSLANNVESGQPVRVLERLDDGRYLYRGLYEVTDAREEVGKRGFLICRYELVVEQIATAQPGTPPPPGTAKPKTKFVGSTRTVRDTRVTLWVKKLYKLRCQIDSCDVSVLKRRGTYSEGAHIRPVGRPDLGPDVPENVLSLCPNHHVALDRGGIYVNDDFTVCDRDGEPIGSLTLRPEHAVDIAHLKHHRQKWAY